MVNIRRNSKSIVTEVVTSRDYSEPESVGSIGQKCKMRLVLPDNARRLFLFGDRTECASVTQLKLPIVKLR